MHREPYLALVWHLGAPQHMHQGAADRLIKKNNEFHQKWLALKEPENFPEGWSFFSTFAMKWTIF